MCTLDVLEYLPGYLPGCLLGYERYDQVRCPGTSSVYTLPDSLDVPGYLTRYLPGSMTDIFKIGTRVPQ